MNKAQMRVRPRNRLIGVIEELGRTESPEITDFATLAQMRAQVTSKKSKSKV